jgi:hypothetical protein
MFSFLTSLFGNGILVETQRKLMERGYKNGQINTAIKKIQNET